MASPSARRNGTGEAIERTMGHLSEPARANVLGLNAARFFGFEVPAT